MSHILTRCANMIMRYLERNGCDDRTEESKIQSLENGLLASPTGAYFSVTSGCFDDDIKMCHNSWIRYGAST